MTLPKLYRDLGVFMLGDTPDEDDGLAVMLLLHTQHLWFARPLMEDRPGITELCATTQRHAAEVVADAWPDWTAPEKKQYAHWYWLFNTRTPYEVVDGMPDGWVVRLTAMKAKLTQHPEVTQITSED